jgi:hypothetical protein
MALRHRGQRRLADNQQVIRCLPILVLAAWPLAMAAPSLAAGPTPQRAAECVAALKVRADALTRRLQAGDDTVQGELTAVIERGFAFIGEAYLQGLHDKKQAQALLAAAERAQSGLPDALLVQRQVACRVEADKMLADTVAINRFVVQTAARARVARLKRAGG